MRKKSLQVGVLLFLVILLSSAFIGLSSYAPVQAAPPQSSRQGTTIMLTSNGFAPSVITVTVGSIVTWQNNTSQAYTLQSGLPYRLSLPIMRQPTGAQRQAQGQTARVGPTSDVFNGILPPGGTFTHQFATPGETAYYLAQAPHLTGRIFVVAPGGTPVASATATTGAATATATQSGATPTSAATASPTQQGNASPTPTATASPTQPGNATPTPTPLATQTPSVTPTPTQPAVLDLDVWMMNTTELSAYIKSNATPIVVNVQSVQATAVNSVDYANVGASGIPNYAHTMTQSDIDTITSRPKYSTPVPQGDFRPEGLLAKVSDVIDFGEDIGYSAQGPTTCPVGEGFGYWPKGPSCPTQQNHNAYFPLNPAPATTTCETGGGTIGLWVNGTGIFNWTDGMSYNNQQVWHNTALGFEKYDMDICWGHANQQGLYHHHSYPSCLAEQLNDTGSNRSGHSPIYGFAADGYPLYGPWHDTGQLAQSCWKTRDYSINSPTGCGADNKRTCLLADNFDIQNPVTEPASSAGPDTTATVSSLSSNPIPAVSGVYYEDYYYDSTCTAQGPAYLDEHNGHDHDGYGYHYHVTVVDSGNGTLTGVFPFMIGPDFYGEVQDNAIAMCGGGGGMPLLNAIEPDAHTGHHHGEETSGKSGQELRRSSEQ